MMWETVWNMMLRRKSRIYNTWTVRFQLCEISISQYIAIFMISDNIWYLIHINHQILLISKYNSIPQKGSDPKPPPWDVKALLRKRGFHFLGVALHPLLQTLLWLRCQSPRGVPARFHWTLLLSLSPFIPLRTRTHRLCSPRHQQLHVVLWNRPLLQKFEDGAVAGAGWGVECCTAEGGKMLRAKKGFSLWGSLDVLGPDQTKSAWLLVCQSRLMLVSLGFTFCQCVCIPVPLWFSVCPPLSLSASPVFLSIPRCLSLSLGVLTFSLRVSLSQITS